MSLLVVGSVAFDSIKTPFGKINKTLGGSATYFSLAAGNFTKPAIVAVVGQDFHEEKIFAAKKIDMSGLEKTKGKTFTWGGEYSFDLNSRKTLFTHLNVFQNFEPKLSPVHKLSKYIFLGNIHPSLQLEVLSQLKSPKLVGLDTMNYWMEKTLPELKKVIKNIDVFIINDSEARQLSKEHNLLKAARKILSLMSVRRGPSAAEGPLLIIKRGEYGLLMFQSPSPSGSDGSVGAGRGARGEGFKIFHLPGYPLEDVIDPTGAGDSFAGGFMGYLAKSDNVSWDNLKKACVAGSVMASFCVQELGVKKLLKISKSDINKRLKGFKTLTHFGA